MLRKVAPLTVLFMLCGFFAYASGHGNHAETTDPAVAAKDPDFLIQGENLGEGTWLDGKPCKADDQVIARGDGKFDIVVMKGGLPGLGWKRGDDRFSLTAVRDGDKVTVGGRTATGEFINHTLVIKSRDGKAALQLERVQRHSSTEGEKAPKGAVVLFDGTTADNFIHGTMSADKNLMSEATTKRRFGDYKLHLEFRLSYMPDATGQARSNSGMYLHDCYETQVLDSFGLDGKDNECGGFYQLRQPDVNMCFPPLTWQTYDVEFTAPKYKGGKKVANARVTIKQNGVVIHPNFELVRNTPGREGEGPAPRPLYLQGHGNKVEYRNIWLTEKK